MSDKIIEIEVQKDHLERIAQVRKPLLAIAELIWNSVDADATRVDIILEENELGKIDSIRVADNGHGIHRDEAEDLFSRLGGSWKRGGKTSREQKRLLHGKEGRGRFRALSLGRVVDWDSCCSTEQGLMCFSISMLADDLKKVKITDAVPAENGKKRGTEVIITEFSREPRSLREQAAVEEITQLFALYLRQYPAIQIVYDGIFINPKSMEELTSVIPLPDIASDGGDSYPVSLEIVEWRIHAERRLYFCNTEGFPLDETSTGIQASGFNFTAYLRSDYFSKLAEENRLEIASLDPLTQKTLTHAKEAMRDHFRKRASEKASGLVEKWKEENVYPYEGEPSTIAEQAERQVFNVVALSVNSYLPEFPEADEKSKRLQLRLLRNAVANAPSDLSKILGEILDLPAEKRQELSALLERTTLAAIISASKLVADRLEFVLGLETLVFDKELKDLVRERTQLHRIIAENAWIFGEQYQLSVDDQSLTEVLKKHAELQGREIELDQPVLRADGSRGIVDVMFSRSIQLAGSEDREHLVIELKRPNVKIDQAAANQIESYAFAVADDERFKLVPAKWVFWAISNDIDATVMRKISQKDRPHGILHQEDGQRITIWVKTWAQIINDCKSRLRFFAEKLNYTPDRDSSLAHLKTTYDKYLSDLFSPKQETASPSEDK